MISANPPMEKSSTRAVKLSDREWNALLTLIVAHGNGLKEVRDGRTAEQSADWSERYYRMARAIREQTGLTSTAASLLPPSSSVVGRWQEDPAVRQARGAIAREWDQDLREAEGYRRTSEKLDVTNLLDLLCEAVASCAVVGRERETAAPDDGPIYSETDTANVAQVVGLSRMAREKAATFSVTRPATPLAERVFDEIAAYRLTIATMRSVRTDAAPPARAPLPDRAELARIFCKALGHSPMFTDNARCHQGLVCADALLAALPVPPQQETR